MASARTALSAMDLLTHKRRARLTRLSTPLAFFVARDAIDHLPGKKHEICSVIGRLRSYRARQSAINRNIYGRDISSKQKTAPCPTFDTGFLKNSYDHNVILTASLTRYLDCTESSRSIALQLKDTLPALPAHKVYNGLCAP